MPSSLPDLLVPESIASTTLTAFVAYPKCTSLLSNKAYIPVQTVHQYPSPDVPSAFMSVTLRNSDCIRAVQSLYLPSSSTPPSPSSVSPSARPPPSPPIPGPLRLKDEASPPKAPSASAPTLDGSLHTLYSLGPGCSGHVGISHGGLVATLLDQQMASLLIADSAIVAPRTAYCHVQYVKPVRVPGAVRVVAWKKKREGRKWVVEAEIRDMNGEDGTEDGSGEVLARGETMFLSGEGGKL